MPLDMNGKTTQMSVGSWNNCLQQGILQALKIGRLSEFVDDVILSPKDNQGNSLKEVQNGCIKDLNRENLSLLGANLTNSDQINQLSEFTHVHEDFCQAILRNAELDSLIPNLNQELLFKLLKISEQDDVNEKIINELLENKSYINEIVRSSDPRKTSELIALIAKKATKVDQCKEILSVIRTNEKKLEDISNWADIAKDMLKTKSSGMSIFDRFDITKEADLDIKDKIAFAKKIDNSKQLMNLAVNLQDKDDQEEIMAAQEIIKNPKFDADVAEKLFEHPNIIKSLEATELKKLAVHTSNPDHFKQILQATNTNPDVVNTVIAKVNPKPTGLNSLFNGMANYFPPKRAKYPTWSRKNWWQKPLFAVGQGLVAGTLFFLKPVANTFSFVGNLLMRPRKHLKDLVSGRFTFPFRENPTKLLEDIAPTISELALATREEKKFDFKKLDEYSQNSLLSCESISSENKTTFLNQITEQRNASAANAVSEDVPKQFNRVSNAISSSPTVAPKTQLASAKQTELHKYLQEWKSKKPPETQQLVSFEESNNNAIFTTPTNDTEKAKQAELFVEIAKEMVTKIQGDQLPKPEVELTAADFNEQMLNYILLELEKPGNKIEGLRINISNADTQNIKKRIEDLNNGQNKLPPSPTPTPEKPKTPPKNSAGR